MGTRLSVLWHLFAEGATRPDVVVAPVRAILQRLGPWRDAAAPVTLVEGQRIDAEELVAQLVGQGYRREHQVEHRGELAVRGGIVDIFPSTADAPVRVDLFGDEIDRLTTFDVSDQRSIAPLGCAVVFGCREMPPTAAITARAAELEATEPGGAPTGSAWPGGSPSTAWRRGCRGWSPKSTSPPTSSGRTRRSCSSSHEGCATAPSS